MADFKFQVGAHADLLNNAELVAALAPLRKELARAGAPPSIRRVGGQAAAGGATTFANIIIPGPPSGFCWDVLAWRVSGPDPTAQVGGVATMFRNEAQPSNYLDSTNKGSSSVANQIPNLGTADRVWQWMLLGAEKLVINFTNLANNQIVYGFVDAIEVPYPPGIEE